MPMISGMTVPIQNGDLVTRTQIKAAPGALLRDPVLLVDGHDDDLTLRFAALSQESLAVAAFGHGSDTEPREVTFVGLDDGE